MNNVVMINWTDKLLEFPVLLKASAGGGGKGMRTVYDAHK